MVFEYLKVFHTSIFILLFTLQSAFTEDFARFAALIAAAKI